MNKEKITKLAMADSKPMQPVPNDPIYDLPAAASIL